MAVLLFCVLSLFSVQVFAADPITVTSGYPDNFHQDSSAELLPPKKKNDPWQIRFVDKSGKKRTVSVNEHAKALEYATNGEQIWKMNSDGGLIPAIKSSPLKFVLDSSGKLKEISFGATADTTNVFGKISGGWSTMFLYSDSREHFAVRKFQYRMADMKSLERYFLPITAFGKTFYSEVVIVDRHDGQVKVVTVSSLENALTDPDAKSVDAYWIPENAILANNYQDMKARRFEILDFRSDMGDGYMHSKAKNRVTHNLSDLPANFRAPLAEKMMEREGPAVARMVKTIREASPETRATLRDSLEKKIPGSFEIFQKVIELMDGKPLEIKATSNSDSNPAMVGTTNRVSQHLSNPSRFTCANDWDAMRKRVEGFLRNYRWN